jgi:hypothetical protein
VARIEDGQALNLDYAAGDDGWTFAADSCGVYVTMRRRISPQ